MPMKPLTHLLSKHQYGNDLVYYTLLYLLLSFIILVYKKKGKTVKKIQLLQQEKIQFEFQVLRNQVNPHFLFNSFNTLISYY